MEENARESRDRARYTRNYTRAADAFLVLNADESLTQSKSSTTTDSEGQRYTQSVECEPRQRDGTATCAFGAGLSLHRTTGLHRLAAADMDKYICARSSLCECYCSSVACFKKSYCHNWRLYAGQCKRIDE